MCHSKKRLVLHIALFLYIILLLFVSLRYNNRCRIQRQLSEKIVRFHVIANSDSKRDQALKLKVRDAVGTMLQKKMLAADSKDTCEKLLWEELSEIEQTARNVLLEEGCTDSVAASVQKVDFPVKSYGAYTFPAGTYDALELTIGAGAGHNWWCVMYPNMCFSGSVYQADSKEADAALQEVLDEEEYETVLRTGNYKVQFKYLTFLNQLCE